MVKNEKPEPAADPEQEHKKRPYPANRHYSHRRNAAEDFTPPPGYAMQQESQGVTISVLCAAAVRDALTDEAKERNESRNKLINNILRDYLISEGRIKDE